MYRALVPVDADEEQARTAADAIRSLPIDPDDLEVVVLSVFQEFDVPDEGPRVTSDDYYDEKEFPNSVDVVVEMFEDEGIDVDTRREHGEPAEKILEVADEIDADTIVMSGRKRSPTGKVLFGSVTQKVLLDSECPVITALVD